MGTDRSALPLGWCEHLDVSSLGQIKASEEKSLVRHYPYFWKEEL